MVDISRLCPGCMQEAETVQVAGMQGGKMRREGKCPHCGFEMSGYKQNARCLPVNTILAGKYLVGAALGQGGFGITYMGYDLNMQTRIAIKEYFPVELVSRDTTSLTGDRVISLSGDKSVTYRQGLKKYVEEAQNVSRFSEIPGIVSVKDFFYENETAYIVMEYIEGISLKEYLKERGGRLTEEETLAIMKPVLEALVKVHEAGIVHRDISPDNIMLTFAGERGRGGGVSGPGMNSKDNRMASVDGAGDRWETVRGSMGIVSVRLIDFGAARMTAKNDQKSLTIILKHGYAPEEQYRTHGEQGPWTDVYAVCAVMYRMLAGQTPPSAMDRLFQDDLKSLEELGVQADGNTEAAILKGLAVKKEDRFRDIRETAEALYEGKAVRKASRIKISRAAGIGAGCLLAAIAAGFLFLGWHSQKAKQESASGKTETSMPTEAAALTERDEEGVFPEGGAGTDFSVTETAGAEAVEFEAEELGEAIAFPNPQTSIGIGGWGHVLLRMPDGSVKASGSNKYGQCMVEEWDGIVAVAAGSGHSLGLRSDGKVFAAGYKYWGQCEVENWKDVVQIAAGAESSYGLTADGHILACGSGMEEISEAMQWENIVAITTDSLNGLIGLDREGNVHFAGCGESWGSVTGWQGVVYLSATYLTANNLMLVGMKEDGSIITKKPEGNTYLDGIEEWEGIRQINISSSPVLGVKEDGTVAYTEIWDEKALEEINRWTDMVAVGSVGVSDRICIVGMRQDGTIAEYQRYYGNSAPEEMVNLKWIQTMNIDGLLNLVAGTADGQLLTYGTEPFRMDDLSGLNDGGGLPASEVAGIVGMDALLLKDGSVFHCGRFIDSDADRHVGEDAVQALEVWRYNYSGLIYGYALLTEDGQVRTKIVGDEERVKQEDLNRWEKELQLLQTAEAWTDVVQIAAADGILYGLHGDGSISTTLDGMSEIPSHDIVRIACQGQEMVGIRKDGTAEVIRTNDYAVSFGRTQINSWDSLQDISMGESHVVGLRTDGTVVAAGSNHMNQCDVEEWRDIVFILADKNCTFGITASGELKMAGGLN